MRVIDSTANWTNHIADLKRAGVSGVVRYIGTPSSKCMHRAEFDALTKAGIGVAFVYENTIGDWQGGYQAGVRNANAALAAFPEARQFLWVAIDTDTTNYAAVEAYCSGFCHVLGGKAHVGVYGSGAVIKHVLAAGYASLGWLSLSHGWTGYSTTIPGLALIQHGSLSSLSLDNDWNEAQPFYGQYGYKEAPVAPEQTFVAIEFGEMHEASAMMAAAHERNNAYGTVYVPPTAFREMQSLREVINAFFNHAEQKAAILKAIGK